LLEAITYGNAPPEPIPWDWQEGYRIEAEAEAEAAVEPIYGPPMPAELPARAGAFGPAGEGGMYCPETEGPLQLQIMRAQQIRLLAELHSVKGQSKRFRTPHSRTQTVTISTRIRVK
jgi:hypothetical protein